MCIQYADFCVKHFAIRDMRLNCSELGIVCITKNPPKINHPSRSLYSIYFYNWRFCCLLLLYLQVKCDICTFCYCYWSRQEMVYFFIWGQQEIDNALIECQKNYKLQIGYSLYYITTDLLLFLLIYIGNIDQNSFKNICLF